MGNAAEHGSAVLLARRGARHGKVRLAAEIPLASSAQGRPPDPGGRAPLVGDRAARARLPPGRARVDGRRGRPRRSRRPAGTLEPD
ncbi:MAG: hypothetical protein ACRDLK_13670, partial [Gaiellaceae bacterium]